MRGLLAISAQVARLFRAYGRHGFWAFLALTLLVLLALVLLGDRPVWLARWDRPYRVEVCPSLLALDADALGHIRAAYYHVGTAGHDGPTTIEAGPCDGDIAPGVVRWDVYALAPGIGHGIARLDCAPPGEDCASGVLEAVTVLLRVGEDPDPSLYRHEAWHTIGADHPQMPSTGHVLHPGEPGWVWGRSYRGYRR